MVGSPIEPSENAGAFLGGTQNSVGHEQLLLLIERAGVLIQQLKDAGVNSPKIVKSVIGEPADNWLQFLCNQQPHRMTVEQSEHQGQRIARVWFDQAPAVCGVAIDWLLKALTAPKKKTTRKNDETKPTDAQLKAVRDVLATVGKNATRQTIIAELRKRNAGMRATKLTMVLDQLRETGEYTAPTRKR